MGSASFQVVGVKNMAGTSKIKADGSGGNDYNMLIVSGIHTDEHGVMEVGEVTFMMGRDRAEFPDVKPGTKYLPVMQCKSIGGKLQFVIGDLKPVSASSLSKAA